MRPELSIIRARVADLQAQRRAAVAAVQDRNANGEPFDVPAHEPPLKRFRTAQLHAVIEYLDTATADAEEDLRRAQLRKVEMAEPRRSRRPTPSAPLVEAVDQIEAAAVALVEAIDHERAQRFGADGRIGGGIGALEVAKSSLSTWLSGRKRANGW